MKRILAIFLVMTLCVAMMGSSMALTLTDDEVREIRSQQEEDLARASRYFSARGVWAAAAGDGEIEFGFDVKCPRVMNRLGAIEIEVMRKSGDNWILVETYEYTDSGMSYLYEKNCATKSEAVYFEGTVGRQYYADITLKAVDDDGSESITMSTNVVTAK